MPILDKLFGLGKLIVREAKDLRELAHEIREGLSSSQPTAAQQKSDFETWASNLQRSSYELSDSEIQRLRRLADGESPAEPGSNGSSLHLTHDPLGVDSSVSPEEFGAWIKRAQHGKVQVPDRYLEILFEDKPVPLDLSGTRRPKLYLVKSDTSRTPRVIMPDRGSLSFRNNVADTLSDTSAGSSASVDGASPSTPDNGEKDSFHSVFDLPASVRVQSAAPAVFYPNPALQLALRPKLAPLDRGHAWVRPRPRRASASFAAHSIHHHRRRDVLIRSVAARRRLATTIRARQLAFNPVSPLRGISAYRLAHYLR